MLRCGEIVLANPIIFRSTCRAPFCQCDIPETSSQRRVFESFYPQNNLRWNHATSCCEFVHKHAGLPCFDPVDRADLIKYVPGT